MSTARVARRADVAESEQPKLTYVIGRLDRALKRRMVQALAPLNLSVAQYTVLSVLNARGELSNAQLANRAFISPQAMNEVVRGLESKKLVTRRPDPSHGRIVQLLLTPHGLEVLHECDTQIRRVEQTMLSSLSPAEREALRLALNACVRSLESNAS
jgi:DNA-binding MarR family transcriptional regulator